MVRDGECVGYRIILSATVDLVARRPCRAFLRIVDAVAVGVCRARIHREELVEPLVVHRALGARIVRIDGVAGRILRCGVGTCVLLCKSETVSGIGHRPARRGETVVCICRIVAIERIVASRAFSKIEIVIRAYADVEFPAVRHCIAVGISAMLRHSCGNAAVCYVVCRPILNHLGGEFFKGRIRVGAALDEDCGQSLAPGAWILCECFLVFIDIGKTHDVAVLHQQEFILRCVARGVHRSAGSSVAPAGRSRERAVAECSPAGSWIEAEPIEHLVVIERHALRHRYRVLAGRSREGDHARFVKGHRERCDIRDCIFRGRDVGAVERLHLVGVTYDGGKLILAVDINECEVLVRGVECVVFARRRLIDAEVDLGLCHEVTIWVEVLTLHAGVLEALRVEVEEHLVEIG